jgi:type IV secretory pathway VirJ component
MKQQSIVLYGKAFAPAVQRGWVVLWVVFFCCWLVPSCWFCAGKAALAADRTALANLPLIELPAPESNNDILAIILSGDGGWADLDKTFGEAFQQRGISTVGFDCLKYFWKTRKPAEASRDIEALVRYYLQTWKKKRVLLVGYSFGADWLPFLVNRLPADLLPQIHLCVLLGPSSFVNVEVHVMDWMGDERRQGALDVLPEARLLKLPVLCVSGREEKDSICPLLQGEKVTQLQMPGGHHFHHNYLPVIEAIFNTLQTIEANGRVRNGQQERP